MTYKLTQSTSIIRIEDGACIPADPANSDYQHYLTWVDEGNSPEPSDPIKAADPLTQITALEVSALLPRVTREFMLTFFAAQAAANGVDPMTSPAYVKLKALDDHIATLRRMLE